MTTETAAAAASDDDEVPELEEAIPETEAAAASAAAEGAEGEAGAGAPGKSQNRSEKKSRKMMARLGMRPMPGIARVTLKTAGRGGYFAIDDPDVYVSSGSNPTYVVFGEARQGGGMGGAAAAQQQMRQAKAAQEAAAPKAEEGVTEVPVVAEEGGEEAVDETGVEAKDIELVMSQASCSRAKAVTALKENDGDLVNAIMSLTT